MCVVCVCACACMCVVCVCVCVYVVGKVLGRIVQELQVIAEKILPQSQSGFRKGRGCADMIFVAR